MSDRERILVDPANTAALLVSFLKCSVREGANPSTLMKAQKNITEIENFRKVMEKDGRALICFFRWLEEALSAGTSVTELETAETLRSFREKQTGFQGESFSSIPGYGEHGALCHYEASEEGQSSLIPGQGMFLLDSGGQYLGGTTDITSTITLGEPSAQEQEDFTLVLKGHIALSRSLYPEGTRGYQLDILARKALWDRKIDFGHGTGHGVGYYLNVHEGPQNISPKPIDQPLKEGMITSNEPGVYREGFYGIRIENLLLTVKAGTSDFGQFYSFETLTLFPYDQSLILKGLLDSGEIEWVNDYHKEVLERLSDGLTVDEISWLSHKCRPL